MTSRVDNRVLIMILAIFSVVLLLSIILAWTSWFDATDTQETIATTTTSSSIEGDLTQDSTGDSNLSSYDENWNRFQNFVADNSYDIWLEAELNEGIKMPWYIYSDYIKFLIAEYEFTLEYAKNFFDHEENYLSWKFDNEAWLELTCELYRKEISNFDAQMERLEITIPYSKLIRQKVIDIKYFLYQLEINEKIMVGDVSDEYVALKWKSIETDN